MFSYCFVNYNTDITTNKGGIRWQALTLILTWANKRIFTYIFISLCWFYYFNIHNFYSIKYLTFQTKAQSFSDFISRNMVAYDLSRNIALFFPNH